MKTTKSLKLALNMLIHSKLRSWLTIIGIVIGVTAVVSIISIGNGLQENVNSRLQGLGQDIITISSGSSRAFIGFREAEGGTTTNVKTLSTKDIQTLKLVPGIKAISGIVSGRADVSYLSEKSSISIQGIESATFKDFVTTNIDSGRQLSQGDIRSAVIGNGVATEVFKKDLEVGQIISIGNTPFRIIGILQASSGLGNTDNQMYMSTQDAREVLKDKITLKSNEFSSINVKVNDVSFVDQTVEKIDTALTNSHHVRTNNKDFTVTNPKALQERFSSVTAAVTLFLGAIAAVSLIVGAVGVANTMFTAVLEKTKDIGIMKAVGAKNKDIMLIFLFNSGLLGLVGGIIGVIFGALVSYTIPQLGITLGPGPNEPMETAISMNLLIIALALSMIIGMIAGALPAYRASKLKPVDALRYE